MEIQFKESKAADVICQHNCDGGIIPLKIRITDDDGEFQTYKIKAYKNLTHCSKSTLSSETNLIDHIWKFECKIEVFGRERRINLMYNAYDNKWRVSFDLSYRQ